MDSRETRLPAFYSGLAGHADLLYERRQPITEGEALGLVSAINAEGASLGLCLEKGLVLQFIRDKEGLWGEESLTEIGHYLGCYLTNSLAAKAVGGAFRGLRILKSLDGCAVNWDEWILH